MSYDKAKQVRESMWELLRYDKTVLVVGVDNQAGKFSVVVGSTHPKGVEAPEELDGVPIRIVELRPSSPYEPAD